MEQYDNDVGNKKLNLRERDLKRQIGEMKQEIDQLMQQIDMALVQILELKMEKSKVKKGKKAFDSNAVVIALVVGVVLGMVMTIICK